MDRLSRKEDSRIVREVVKPTLGRSLVHRPFLERLRRGIQRVYNRRGRRDADADLLFQRLSANLSLLQILHPLALGTLHGDRNDARSLYAHISDLAGRLSGIQGSASILRSRGGPLSRRGSSMQAFSAAGLGIPCGLVEVAGMAEIYAAVWAVYAYNLGELTQPPSNELQQAVDVVAGLSLGNGNLEVLHREFERGGIDRLEVIIEWAEATANPDFVPGKSDGSGQDTSSLIGGQRPETYLDNAGTTPGATARSRPFMGGPDSGSLAKPPAPGLPYSDECELVREACEGMLIEIFDRGAPQAPPPVSATWADNIDYIEDNDLCAGDTLIIHGHYFGNVQPDNVELIMNVNGVCTALDRIPIKWSNTRIEVSLPEGVTPGPVGFYNPDNDLGVSMYNQWVGQVNQDLQAVVGASRCLGTPFEVPTMPQRQTSSKCPPLTDVNFIQAGKPIIQTFEISAGEAFGSVVVAEPEDILTLRWNVENAASIRLERLTNAAPGFGPDASSNRIVNPQGTSYELGQAGHTQWRNFEYRLVAENQCTIANNDPVDARVQVIATKRPGLAIDAIEVTQGVQTMDRGVNLVAHKPTVVRVYASHDLDGFGANAVEGVKGRMRVIQSSGEFSSWYDPINYPDDPGDDEIDNSNPPYPPFPRPAAEISLAASVNQPSINVNDTVNFVIPSGLCEGTLDIEVEIRVEDFGAPDGEQGLEEQVSRRFEGFSFHERRPLKIRFIPAKIDDSVGDNINIQFVENMENPPTDQQCQDFLMETFKYLPTTPESIERLEGHEVTIEANRLAIATPSGDPFYFTSPTPIQSESAWFDYYANRTLETFGLLKMCAFSDITGRICSDEADAIWVILVPLTGVWGRAHWSTDVCITPMRQISAAHEIAHTLDQQHIGVNCRGNGPSCGGQAFVGGDPTTDPANWEDGSAILPSKVVPFDVIQNETIDGGTCGVWDLMTYCSKRWTSPQRWVMLFNHERLT